MLDILSGKVLVINGPTGSGKSVLAKTIAAYCGTYTVMSAYELRTAFGLGSALSDRPDTVIVEEFTPDPVSLATAKSLVSEPTVEVNRKGQEPVRIPTPNFIFVTGAENPLGLTAEDRRFKTIDIDTEHS